MSLTNRLSIYFLAALGVVLAGFSAALFTLASEHLHAVANHRLDAASQTLVAAIEVHPDDVEWEPLERRIVMGEDSAPDQIRWAVHAADGRLVDCSGNLEQKADGTLSPTDPGWTVIIRRVRAGSFHADPATPFRGSFSGGFPAGQIPGTVPLPKDRTFHGGELVLSVGLAEEPVAGTLRQLATALTLISVAVWLAAAVCGRWLCRRALAPVIRMAASARALRLSSSEGSFLEVALTHDELEDLGTAFNELLADLRESLEKQRRFTGDASHQLRTPLAALLASVEVSLLQERPPSEYRKVLEVVRRRGGQLRQVLESLLFLARPEADSRPSPPEAVEIGDWCRARIHGWAEHERAADIQLELPAAPTVVRTHPALLGQVLDNLLDNGVKYSAAGTPITISIEVEERLTMTVADEGCGIAAGELAKIFEPFYRAAAARWEGKPGVGLGLTVAQRLVGILGGQLDVRSEVGKGSRFRVVLPLETVRPVSGAFAEVAKSGSLDHVVGI